MSTRSRIGLQQADGTIKSIYCHFDGYPEGVGAELKKHYTTIEKVKELLELGDISILGEFYDEELAKKAWEHQYEKEWRESPEGQRADKMTLPYKDRGETGTDACVDKDELAFISNLSGGWEEYAYLYKTDYDGVYKWFVIEAPYSKVLE